MGERQSPVENMGMSGQANAAFWHGKRVFVTGNTGFKGSWLTLMLQQLGAHVSGYALPPPGQSLWNLLELAGNTATVLADIADSARLHTAMVAADPHIILHLAAQPLVRASYADPAGTLATNVGGTLHVLECARQLQAVKVILVVTSDKVYRNESAGRAFVEEDALGGHDPYSASKAACEILVASWARCFFDARGLAVATARAGNVIGGGDFAPERLVPDVYRSFSQGACLTLRYPQATRPWHHVLDCLNGYLLYAQHLYGSQSGPFTLNFGPSGPALPVKALVEQMQAAFGMQPAWQHVQAASQPFEAAALALNSQRARSLLAWQDRLSQAEAVTRTATWYAALVRGQDMRAWSLAELAAFTG